MIYWEMFLVTAGSLALIELYEIVREK